MKVYFAIADSDGTKIRNYFAIEDHPLFELIKELKVDQWDLQYLEESEEPVCMRLAIDYIDEMQILMTFPYSSIMYFADTILHGQYANKYKIGNVFVGTDKAACAKFIGDLYMSNID